MSNLCIFLCLWSVYLYKMSVDSKDFNSTSMATSTTAGTISGRNSMAVKAAWKKGAEPSWKRGFQRPDGWTNAAALVWSNSFQSMLWIWSHFVMPLKSDLDVKPGNTKGEKYHCTIDLLFDWFGLVCFVNENKYCQLSYSWFQTSQTGGQRYSVTFPFSIPWLNKPPLKQSISKLGKLFLKMWKKIKQLTVRMIKRDSSVRRERVNMHCHGNACTRSFYMVLSSAEVQKLVSFKINRNNIFMSSMKIYQAHYVEK